MVDRNPQWGALNQEVVGSIPAAGSSKVFHPGRQLQRFLPSEPVGFVVWTFHQLGPCAILSEITTEYK